MRKVISLIALFAVALGAINIGKSVGAKSVSKPHRTVIDVNTYGMKDGGFATNWYRLKEATNVTVTYSAVANSRAVKKNLRLPKGTIVGAERYHHGNAPKANAYSNGYMSPNLSYHLKSKLVTHQLYGFGAVSFNLSPKKVTRVVRPTYGLPYGSGTMYAGGLTSIKTLNRNVDAIKLTSDGYIETYRNNPRNYSSFWGTLQSHYASKPTDATKINLSVKNGDTIELYYSHHLKGVTDKKVRQSGETKYRLEIKNQHTPYKYEDSAYFNKQAVASIYTVGGSSYFTVIGAGKVN